MMTASRADDDARNDAERWLNLAVEASNDGRPQEAEPAFLAALAADPTLADAHLGLGLTYMALRRFTEAVEPLRRAADSLSAPAAWRACLAQSLYMTGDFAGSAKAFDLSAQGEDLGDNARATLASARCLARMIEGRVNQALEAYQVETGVDLDQLVDFAESASAILGVFGHTAAAAATGRWRLAHAPGDLVTAYRLSALEGAAVDRAPSDYVEAHFDAFADRFDHQLVEMLNYSVPADLAALVARVGSQFDHVLDLGCGTGLAVNHLTPLAGRVTGVDLSSGMLERAWARGGYTRLVQAEAVAFLIDHPATFDLVFAADVLVYFGDLVQVFQAAAEALRPGGYFAFSTERADVDWILLSSGRFAHAVAYVDRQAATAFAVKARASAILRNEGSAQVEGVLHVLVRL